jgi:hypothetical protein
MWVSGKPTRCLDPECASTSLVSLGESFDVDNHLYVGTVRCEFGHDSLYTRKDDTMAKTKKGSKKKAAARARTTARPLPLRKPKPRTPALPGMEDHAIKPLEDIATAYADVRDRRIELNAEEHELKDHAKALMKKYDKTIYKHGGVEIRIVPGEDDVKVKIAKPGDEVEDTDDGEDVEITANGGAEPEPDAASAD